ncbi:MAG: secondary thiamine-phosphate synthase enzyme YjbQ [Candidatus Diapherotrites archaeon]
MFSEISVKSSKRNELIDVSAQIEKAVKESGVKEGFCLVFCPHTTAAVTINENADPSVKEDLLGYFSKLVPEHGRYLHSEGNSDAHIKSSLIGASVFLPVKNSGLVLGAWQGIFFCEFDGPRNRKLMVLVK